MFDGQFSFGWLTKGWHEKRQATLFARDFTQPHLILPSAPPPPPPPLTLPMYFIAIMEDQTE